MTKSDIEIVLHQLAATPDRIAVATKDVTVARLQFRADPEDWSIHDILAHLRACADVWGKSIRAMITQQHPTLRYVSPRTWMRKTHYAELEFELSFEAFCKQRIDLLKMLQDLSLNDWSRGATFTGTTRGKEQTILSYAQRLAQHENEHLAQLEDALK